MNMAFPVRSVAFALAGVLLSSAAPAQEKGSTVTETARVVVIEIPVNVVGKDGQPVRGLTAADFELTDDGKKHEISGFEVIDLSAAPLPTAENPFPEAPPPAARRHWLLVFDLSFSSLNGLLRAREGAQGFVKSGLKENDLASVATFSVDTGWKLVVNFTQDRKQLAEGISTLGLPGLAVKGPPDPLAFAIAPLGQSAAGGGLSGEGSAREAALRETAQDFQRLQQSASDDRARGRVAQLLNSFGTMARALDAVRGKKHILYFSEGFESRLLSGNAGDAASPLEQSSPTQDNANEASVAGEYWKIDSDSRFGSGSTRGRLAEALSVFNRSDAVLHTIDITGVSAGGDVVEKAGSGKDALFTMASQTGGEFIRNANQLQGGLDQISQRTGVTYLLAYQPTKLTSPGQFHKLRVKVKSSGARVSARSGYYEPKPFRSLSPIERILATGDLITGGKPRDDIPARLLAAPFAGEKGEAQVPVILEIPGLELLAGDTGAQTGIQIYAYATDSGGTLRDYLTQEMTLDLAKARPSIEAAGIKFYGTLYLPTGDYTLRSLVRNVTTGRSGLQTARLRIPAMPGGSAVVLPPVFQESAGKWIMAKGTPRADAPPRVPDYPFAIGGDSFIPAAGPILTNGAETKITVFTYNFTAGEKPAPLQVRSEIIAADGKTQPADVKLARESGIERGGARKLLLTFKPEGLTPGRYALKVAVSDPVSKKASESASAFEVR
jgi:VWFA-related protein